MTRNVHEDASRGVGRWDHAKGMRASAGWASEAFIVAQGMLTGLTGPFSVAGARISPRVSERL